MPTSITSQQTKSKPTFPLPAPSVVVTEEDGSDVGPPQVLRPRFTNSVSGRCPACQLCPSTRPACGLVEPAEQPVLFLIVLDTNSLHSQGPALGRCGRQDELRQQRFAAAKDPSILMLLKAGSLLQEP
jgi:hypothetical protein